MWGDKLYKLKDQAVYNRLDQKNDVLELFFQHVSSLLRQRLQPYAQKLAPQFPHVYAIDATKLEQVKRLMPSLRDIKSSSTELLAGQIQEHLISVPSNGLVFSALINPSKMKK